jgi:hypothetical protein
VNLSRSPSPKLRIPIRIKLLLLVIALAPLTVVSFLDVRATSHLGENLANRTSETITRERCAPATCL